MLTLDQLLPGRTGRVRRVKATGFLAQRLGEMGVLEGAEVRMVRSAPLGDPLALRVESYLLSMRKADARLIEVAEVPERESEQETEEELREPGGAPAR